MSVRYPCPCCGRLVFEEPPGSYDICPVCFWEDDVVQLRWPDWTGGANRPSLIEAQATYARTGVMQARPAAFVRPPAPDEHRDPGWRPIDLHQDDFEARGEPERDWPDDRVVLYWWRPTFWRA